MTPLPLRSNNPLSLVYNPAIKYQGLANPPFLGNLFNFQTQQLGYRAATLNARSYLKRGIDTLVKFIAVWSPAVAGNPTSAYIKNVEAWSGILRTRKLTEADFPKLFWAMTQQECGEEVSIDIINEGIAMAGNDSKFSNVVGKTVGSAPSVALGGYIATLIQNSLHDFAHFDVNASSMVAITGICVIVANHFFSDLSKTN